MICLLGLLTLALCAGTVYFARKARWEAMKARPWFQRVSAQPRRLTYWCAECGELVGADRISCPRCGTM